MDHIKVTSSNIDSIGYDPATEEMEVRFKSKDGEPVRAYSYAAVPYDKYKAFLNAESVGSHFATFVRANYEGHRIDAPKVDKETHEEEKQEAKPKKTRRIS